MYTTGRKLNVVVTSVPRVDGLAAHEARWRRKYIIYVYTTSEGSYVHRDTWHGD